jgi:cytoskeletal protein RodZ
MQESNLILYAYRNIFAREVLTMSDEYDIIIPLHVERRMNDKLKKLFPAIILIMTFVFIFTACGDSEQAGKDETDTTQTTAETNEPLTTIGNKQTGDTTDTAKSAPENTEPFAPISDEQTDSATDTTAQAVVQTTAVNTEPLAPVGGEKKDQETTDRATQAAAQTTADNPDTFSPEENERLKAELIALLEGLKEGGDD